MLQTQVLWKWPEVWLGCRKASVAAESHEKGQFCLCCLLLLHIYMHTRVYMCIPRNRLGFALYLWQEHNYFSFYQIVPLNRGSLNTGSFFILHAGKLGLQN